MLPDEANSSHRLKHLDIDLDSNLFPNNQAAGNNNVDVLSNKSF